MKIKFFGAAKTVAGSCYGIQTSDRNILIGCGIFQGTKGNEQRNVESFQFTPLGIHYALLTHVHLDHSGRIPKRLKDGVKDRMLEASATVEFARTIQARLQFDIYAPDILEGILL